MWNGDNDPQEYPGFTLDGLTDGVSDLRSEVNALRERVGMLENKMAALCVGAGGAVYVSAEREAEARISRGDFGQG